MMKKELLKFCLLVIPAVMTAKSGFTASFKSSQPVNGTNVGFKLEMINPYIGFDLWHFDVSGDITETEWDWNSASNELFKSWELKDNFVVETNLLVPHAGMKLFIIESTLKFYLLADVMQVFPQITFTTSGKEVEYDSTGAEIWQDKWDDSYDLEKDAEELQIVGFTGAFGIEYRFTSSVTIGGEYGLRTVQTTLKDASDEQSADGKWKDEWNRKIDSELAGTYTSFTLNFYF